MTKPALILLIVASVVLVSLGFAQQTPEAPHVPAPIVERYQLKLDTSDHGTATVYVIDTSTSEVWQYNRSGRNWIALGLPDNGN